jgi:hypothetical protein
MKDSEVVAGMAGGARAQRHAGRRRGRLLRSRGGAERPASGGGLPRAGPAHGRVHGVGRRGALRPVPNLWGILVAGAPRTRESDLWLPVATNPLTESGTPPGTSGFGCPAAHPSTLVS